MNEFVNSLDGMSLYIGISIGIIMMFSVGHILSQLRKQPKAESVPEVPIKRVPAQSRKKAIYEELNDIEMKKQALQSELEWLQSV